jgi:hypothetical protein
MFDIAKKELIIKSKCHCVYLMKFYPSFQYHDYLEFLSGLFPVSYFRFLKTKLVHVYN